MKKSAFKQRMVGAIFILSLGVIFIPVILDTPDEETRLRFTSKPEAPALPEISDVAKINYVFNEVEEKPQVEPQVLAEIKPEPEPEPAPQHKPQVVAQVPVAKPALVSPKVHGDWTIQLGAFSSQENANELMARLRKQGFDTYLKKSPGTKLVKVYVAPGVEKNKAEALKSKLDAELGIKGILVRYQES